MHDLTLTWDYTSLVNLVARRALNNDLIRKFYAVDADAILGNVEMQSNLLGKMFPEKVPDPPEGGAKKWKTFDWMLSRTRDGSGYNAPRELIYLISEARNRQISRLEKGHQAPQGPSLFDPDSLKEAMHKVSEFRYERTLCAEYPTLRHFVERLEGSKPGQDVDTLSRIWGGSKKEALGRANQLVDAGFFERKGPAERPWFRVPHLYRAALKISEDQ
jgi:hypothetical protein